MTTSKNLKVWTYHKWTSEQTKHQVISPLPLESVTAWMLIEYLPLRLKWSGPLTVGLGMLMWQPSTAPTQFGMPLSIQNAMEVALGLAGILTKFFILWFTMVTHTSMVICGKQSILELLTTLPSMQRSNPIYVEHCGLSKTEVFTNTAVTHVTTETT